MQKKVTETTATFGLGYPMQSKLFAVSSGPYTGRRAALIQTSATEIKLAWSDAPGSGWSSLIAIASDAANQTFDARMAANGDIHIVYSEQFTNYLVTHKLTFGDGTWSVGTKVTVYNGAQCYDPSLSIAQTGDLWVSYSRFATPTRCIYVKSSSDSGATWGSGAGDAGDQIHSGSMFAWSRLVVDGSSVHVIYHDQDAALSIRSKGLSGGSWSNPYDIATGSGFDSNFDAAVGDDGRLGVVYRRGPLFYREYDGSNWGAIATLTSLPVICPQMLFEGNVPAAVYLDPIGSDTRVARFVDRRTGAFEAAKVLDGRSAPFDSVLLYDASAADYQDLTSQAASITAADVYHSSSGCLVKDSGDNLYLGMDGLFRVARMTLSTVGIGGTLQLSYWDGTSWETFTPANGNADLAASIVDWLFWTDYAAIPVNWQKRVINGQSRYWIKATVVSDYTTGPVASQIAAASKVDRLIFRR